MYITIWQPVPCPSNQKLVRRSLHPNINNSFFHHGLRWSSKSTEVWLVHYNNHKTITIPDGGDNERVEILQIFQINWHTHSLSVSCHSCFNISLILSGTSSSILRQPSGVARKSCSSSSCVQCLLTTFRADLSVVTSPHIISIVVTSPHIIGIVVTSPHVTSIVVTSLQCLSNFIVGSDKWRIVVLCPTHAHLPARNGLVNKVEFLGLITQ